MLEAGYGVGHVGQCLRTPRSLSPDPDGQGLEHVFHGHDRTYLATETQEGMEEHLF